MLKVVLDTNIIVSLAIKKSGNSERIFSSLKNRKITLIISYDMLEEMLAVLSRPRIRKFTKMTKRQIKQLARLLLERSIVTSPHHKVSVCRDKDDNKFLEAAISGRADYIVSGDKDLLVLKKYKGIKIIKLSSFVNLF